MKMVYKLAVIIVSVFIFMCILVLFSNTELNSQKKLITELTERRFNLYQKSSDLLEAVLLVDRRFEILLTTQANEDGVIPEAGEKFKYETKELLEKHVDLLDEILLYEGIDAEERKQFQIMYENLKKYQQITISVVTMGQLGGGNGLKSTLEQAERNSLKIKETVKALKEYETRKIMEIKKYSVEKIKKQNIFFPIIAVICVIIPMLISWGMIKLIIRDLKKEEMEKREKEAEKQKLKNEMELAQKEAEKQKLEDEIKLAQKEAEKQKLQGEVELANKEMEIARQIQIAIVPKKPIDEEFNIAATMEPAEKVGGDYYDYMTDSTGKKWFAIGDVSGHGVTSGLIMMMAQTSFSTVLGGSISEEAQPSEIANRVNKTLVGNIKERLKESHFMTMCFLKYEGFGDFTHAGKHLDIIVYRKRTKTIELIKTSGMWLGVLPDIEKITTNNTFHVDIGDIVLLHTDGVDESRNENDRSLLGVKKIHDTIKDYADEGVNTVVKRIKEAALKWCGYKPDDDITMLAIERKV
jgi:serine phosphatase RsbU (regulator of sigma subunit)